MGAAILRQWLVLTMLPKSPRRIDAASIESRLRERGIEVHRRTIQRDLIELANVFPIVADERAKPYGWRWSDDARFAAQVASPREGAAGDWIDVAIRVRKDALLLVLESLGARNMRVSEEPPIEGQLPSEDLLTTVLVAVEDSRCVRRLLLGYGDEIEVIAPLHVRRQIAARARRALRLHSG